MFKISSGAEALSVLLLVFLETSCSSKINIEMKINTFEIVNKK
jgi:hypothetical protein